MTASFRVTHRSGSALMVNGLQRSLARLQDTQERMSTGRQINRASDSPGGTVTALRLRSELALTEQYARNADDGRSAGSARRTPSWSPRSTRCAARGS